MSSTKTKAKKLAPREVRIDGEVYEVTNVRDLGNDGWDLDVDGPTGREFIVFETREKAGEASRDRWRGMAENDPKEFRCMVGDETLIAWALGEYAGPGSTKVTSLNEWLELHLDVPEEEWASYDSNERTLEACGSEIAEELGFASGVAYRQN